MMLHIGFGTAEITPTDHRETLYHRRQGMETAETPIKDPLFARATAFCAGEKTAVWLTLDLLCVDSILRTRISKALVSAGLGVDSLTVCATHTHTAPSVISFHSRYPTHEETFRGIVSGTVAAVSQAIESVAPSEIAYGEAPVAINVNRREIGRMRDVNDLTAPTGLVDPLARVLRLSHVGTGHTGLLVNYTAHPLTMAKDVPLISADFPGQTVRKLLERDGVVHAQFLQGCAGNINVKISGDEREADLAGALLAEGALTAADSANPSEGTGLNMSSHMARLPWARFPTLEEAQDLRGKARAGEPVPDVGRGDIAVDWADALCQRLEAGGVPPYIDTLVQAVRVGDATLLALPGEVFVEIGQQIREQTGAEQLLIAAYANADEVGYVPTASAFPEGGYEVDIAPYYYGLFKLTPECERVLVRTGITCVRDVLP